MNKKIYRWKLDSLYKSHEEFVNELEGLYEKVTVRRFSPVNYKDIFDRLYTYYFLSSFKGLDNFSILHKKKLIDLHRLFKEKKEVKNDKNNFFGFHVNQINNIYSSFVQEHLDLNDEMREKRREAYRKISSEYLQQNEKLSKNLLLFIENNHSIYKRELQNMDRYFSLSDVELLKEEFKKDLSFFQSALNKKASFMNLDFLEPYDLSYYVNRYNDIPLENAVQIISETLSEVNQNFYNIFSEGIESGRFELSSSISNTVCLNFGKLGSYVVMNYDNGIDDMFSLIHEIGHYIENSYKNSNGNNIIDTLLSEIYAITFELILLRKLIRNSNKEDYIEFFLELYRENVFSQLMFHEYEEHLYDMENRNKTNVPLNEIYTQYLVEYFGVRHIKEEFESIGFLRSIHYYNSMYFIKYVIAFVIALKISKEVVFNQRGLKLLQSIKKNFNDIYELLNFWGVDFPETIQEAINDYRGLVKDFEYRKS